MDIIKKSKTFISFIVFVFLAVILSLNYSMGNYFQAVIERPFGLSENYLMFEKTNTSKDLYDIINIKRENEIVMLLKSKTPSHELGIFDPQMKYYLASSAIMSPGIRRYFSDIDYNTKSNVAIRLSDCSPEDFNQFPNSKNSEGNYEILDCLEDSPLTYDNTQIIRNIFAMESNIGDVIYLDSNNKEKVNKYKKILTQNGYKELTLHKNRDISILHSIRYGLQNKHSMFLLVSCFTLLFFQIVVCKAYTYNIKTRVILHRICGGRFLTIIKTLGLPLLWISVALCACIYFILQFISELTKNTSYISPLNFIYILIGYIVFIGLDYIIEVAAIYRYKKKG